VITRGTINGGTSAMNMGMRIGNGIGVGSNVGVGVGVGVGSGPSSGSGVISIGIEAAFHGHGTGDHSLGTQILDDEFDPALAEIVNSLTNAQQVCGLQSLCRHDNTTGQR